MPPSWGRNGKKLLRLNERSPVMILDQLYSGCSVECVIGGMKHRQHTILKILASFEMFRKQASSFRPFARYEAAVAFETPVVGQSSSN